MTSPVETRTATFENFIEKLLQKLSQRRIPISTYRWQFNTNFKFQDARELVSYLSDLGITDCYCSPYLTARPGSLHGYDISDHNRLNPELGSEADYNAFVEILAEHHMGQIIDFVPNHMGIMPIGRNQWWKEVLENGPCSPYARFFDIDWEPVKPELKGKVLLPILGAQYGTVLENGELKLGFVDGAITVNYYDNALPINPRHSVVVHQHNLAALQEELGEDNSQLREYFSILASLRNLPIYTESDPELIIERYREKEVARERLHRLVDAAPRIKQHIEENLRIFNGQPGVAESFDQLHELLEQQAYRLAYWRTAAHEINYRRFFDINELAGLRMEDPEVFNATHALVLRLIREEKITGLRLDHIDGLFDPASYLDHLQTAILLERAAALTPDGVLSDDWRERLLAWRAEQRQQYPQGLVTNPLYTVAEKILSLNERVPENWMLQGTSGYDFLNDLNGIFIDQKNEELLKRTYMRFSGLQKSYAQIVYESKRRIMHTAMSSELNVLAYALNRISEGNRRSRDFTLNSLRDALREVVACFFKYRTYVNESGWLETDRETILHAIIWAQRRNPTVEKSIFDFIYEVVLPQKDRLSPEEYKRRLDFAMKFQQYTSPVQAKGVEDTAFYRYHMLTSINEVGGEPQRFGRLPEEFHNGNQSRFQDWRYGMLSTATHDTKRGEDVRARLNILSEIPEDWSWELSKWELLNAGNRTVVFDEVAPDRNDEYFFYQTLVGIWPPGLKYSENADGEAARKELIERLRTYLIKAIREAKVHTSWINENNGYETAMTEFMEKTINGPDAESFFSTFIPFQRRVAQLGMINSLSQVVLKIASPGVPDFYQGCELWDLSLVDPDNRRPVDYQLRRQLLAEVKKIDELSSTAEQLAALAAMLEHWEDGRIKLFITMKGLQLRRRLPELFLAGEYLRLSAESTFNDNLIAFARQHKEQSLIAIVPRLITRLTTPDHMLPIGADSWKTTRILLPESLSKKSFRNLFTNEQVRPIKHNNQNGIFMAEALRTFPVALLLAE